MSRAVRTSGGQGNRKRGSPVAPARRSHSILMGLCVMILLGISSYACKASDSLAAASPGSAALFSWSSETVSKADEALFELMRQEELNVLYQTISSKKSCQEQLPAFVERAMEEGIAVYYLTGDAPWGLDPDGDKLCEAVENAAACNRRIQRKFLEQQEKDGKKQEPVPQLAGIVFDVEPYLLDEWDEDPDKVMNSFVSGMKKAYSLAREYGLEVIVCIPWYYDKKGQQEGLEELIKNGCDSIAVMNYYRGSEVKHIATEAELARKHGKGLITIYELQKANGRGVQEVNTYYNFGLDALERNYKSILAAYPEQTISIAYHDYRALQEVLNK